MSTQEVHAERPWQWQEGDYTVTRSIAWSGPGCHDGCGVLLYTKGGELKKVEGDPENPFNKGRLCPRCLALPDVANHPDRIQYPMKRVGERGENKWQRISWDEAYDTIEARFKDIKAKYGPEAVIFARGTGRDAGLVDRLAYSFGSPHHTSLGLSGNACYLPRVSQMVITQGGFATVDSSQYFPDRYDHPGWVPPKCLVIWGNNPLAANSDGFYGHWVVDLMKRGTELIVVDPRLTWLASRAKHWLQIRPGTDAALALGFLNVIINENLYDHDFVENWTYGFEDLKKRVQDYPPSKVAEITWIPEEKIVEAARFYAQSKPAAIQWGLAVDMTKEATAAGMAISDLWAITGNLDVPGGNQVVVPPFGVAAPWLGGFGYELLPPEVHAKRAGVDKYPMLGFGFLIDSADELVDQMLTDEPYPIKAAWLETNNPLACMSADPQKQYRALKRMDFVVVVDLFMTPTATAVADIVLPAGTYAERDSIRALWYFLGSINKAVQVGEAKGDHQIQLEMGKRLNPEAWPWDNVQDLLSAEMGTSGMSFQELRDGGVWRYPPFEYRKYEKGMLREDGEPGFNTPSTKIELSSILMQQWGYDPLPFFEEPPDSPVSRPDLAKEYPLILTTGARPWGYFHSEHRQVPVLRELHPEPTVEIHPDDAARYGIQEGDWVTIENRYGKCKQRAHITPAILRGVVNADHAWWFPEKAGGEPSLFGLWESNVNQLIPFQPGRTGFGAPYKANLCKIYKEEG